MTPVSLAALFSDYFNCVHFSAKQKGFLHYLIQARRILVARLKYGIGARLYSLFDLSLVEEKNWPDYIIDEPLKVVQRASSPLQVRKIVDNKLAFFEHCKANTLPTIPVVGLMSHTRDIQKFGVPSVNTSDQLAGLFEDYGPRLFFKLIDGSHGRNAFVAKRSGTQYEFNGTELPLEDFFAYCMAHIEDESGWLVQPVATNHTQMTDYMASGLGTVRIVTFVGAGVPEVVGACLRITTGTGVVDNFSHGRSGNFVAAIDLNSGELGVARGSSRIEWPVLMSYTNHPLKGVPIAGRELPHWRETVSLVLQAHQTLPALKMVGWDVAITERGPILVEANSTCDVDLLQVACQKGFRPWFRDRQFAV